MNPGQTSREGLSLPVSPARRLRRRKAVSAPRLWDLRFVRLYLRFVIRMNGRQGDKCPTGSNSASPWTEGKDGTAIQSIKEHQPEGHLGQVKAEAGGPGQPVVYQL